MQEMRRRLARWLNSGVRLISRGPTAHLAIDRRIRRPLAAAGPMSPDAAANPSVLVGFPGCDRITEMPAAD